MGKGISKTRQISSDRVGKKRKQKNKIIIAVEGKNKTEKIYFSHYDNGKKGYSISFAKGKFTDPLNLVKMLIKEIQKLGLDLTDGDEAYCVFDTDMDPSKNNIIKSAKRLAEDNDIKIISSTPSIELWFLLHYEYTTANMDNKTLIKRLKSFNSKYDKNVDIYLDINNNVDIAIDRAIKLEKYQQDNNFVIGTTFANPSTEVYKIVSHLINYDK